MKAETVDLDLLAVRWRGTSLFLWQREGRAQVECGCQAVTQPRGGIVPEPTPATTTTTPGDPSWPPDTSRGDECHSCLSHSIITSTVPAPGNTPPQTRTKWPPQCIGFFFRRGQALEAKGGDTPTTCQDTLSDPSYPWHWERPAQPPATTRSAKRCLPPPTRFIAHPVLRGSPVRFMFGRRHWLKGWVIYQVLFALLIALYTPLYSVLLRLSGRHYWLSLLEEPPQVMDGPRRSLIRVLHNYCD